MKKFISTMLLLVLAVGLLSGMGTEKVQAATLVYESENNDTRNVANQISSNEQMIGAITAGDVDYYKYTVSGTGYFTVNFSQYDYLNEDKHYNVVIYDSSLNKVTEGDYLSSYTSEKLNFKKGTVFYIAVSGYNSSTDYSQDGHYSVELNWVSKSNWEIESNDTKKTATKLSAKKIGTMYTGDDVDFYKYTATKKGYVAFSFINEDGVTDTSGWNVYVYDSSLNELVSETSLSTDYSIGSYIVKKGTVLYIKVTKSGSAIINKEYSIAPKFKAKTYIETESNNSLKKANKIKLKKAYTGALNSKSDTDYYKIKATTSGTYKASLNFTTTIPYEYELVIYDSAKKEIKTSSKINTTGSVKFKAKKGKTYYVQVKHASYWGYAWNYLYTLKVKK